jgi:hypothetical protein
MPMLQNFKVVYIPASCKCENNAALIGTMEEELFVKTEADILGQTFKTNGVPIPMLRKSFHHEKYQK